MLALKFRLLHWGVAFCVLLNAFVLDEGKQIHRYLGYSAIVLVALRIIFWKQRKITHYNDKAKYVYWCIWFCILGLSLTGFLMGLDRFFGNQTLEDIHEIISNVLLFLTGIHLLGLFFDAFKNKRKTWMVMISGEKL